MSMEKDELISQAESLFAKKQLTELYGLLTDGTKNKFMDDPDICWRMAWACHEYSNLFGEDKKKRKELTFEGYKYAIGGCEKDNEHGECNLWAGIYTDLTAEYDGLKKRVESSSRVKQHFEKALEKNPQSPLALHCLGVWYFEVADIAWYEKKLLSFFTDPPNCTYEDGLRYFEAAEKAEPNFYSCNLLYLGKCYLKMGQKDKAKHFLERCVAYDGDSMEDEEAKTEARQLLKKM